MSKHISRRAFLGKASCAAVGSVTLFSGLFNLKTTALLASNSHRMNLRPQGDYKALVCILLAGGNDSFNMLVPTDSSAYNHYTTTRSNQSLAQDSLLAVNAGNVSESYGVHPSMPEVQQMFQQGDLSFIANVGTLVERIPDKSQISNFVGKLPVGLFSHADQIMQWQTSVPQSRTANGWGGRLADLLQASNQSQDISMNISLSGNNVFQSGNQVVGYSITPGGSIGIRGYNGNNAIDQIRTTAVNNLLERQYQDVFRQSYADITSQSQSNHDLFSAATDQVNLNTIFSANPLSQSMGMIARTIGARDTLGMNRQTFFVTLDGWDNHDELLNSHAALLTYVSQAMGEFNAAMKELGVHDEVTTFTISDFARTLTSNGNGTDHGWGGNVMVMGGTVDGGKIFGEYPTLELNQNLDVGNGVLIPTLSTDEYFAELALWLGVAPSDLPLVLPNIGNFYDPTSGTAPIGFLK
ncbi:MAG: DUF1501 domain-containing protein [Bacteroidota bacterium]